MKLMKKYNCFMNLNNLLIDINDFLMSSAKKIPSHENEISAPQQNKEYCLRLKYFSILLDFP